MKNWKINFYDDILFESYGSNHLVEELTDKIFNLINSNLGKLLLKKELQITNSISHKYINFENDIINIKISNRNYGNVNVSKLDISDKIKNLIINLEFTPTKNERISKRLFKNNKLYNNISHELLHVIELYLTEKNKNNKSKSWKEGEILNDLINKYNDKNWQDISYLIYLSLPHEQRSRIQQLNTEISSLNFKDINEVVDFIKKSKIYSDVKFISMLDSSVILNKLKNDKNYSNIIYDFNNDFLNKNSNEEKNFIQYINNIKSKNQKMLKKLIKISYNFEGNMYENFDKIINYVKNF